MKKILIIALALFTLAGCGLNQQTKQIKALEKCRYKVVSADQISVAGTDIKKLLNNNEINLGSLPAVAFSLLRKDVPLRARLNLEITNPSGVLAAINQFEYKVLINKQELATGFVDQEVNIPAGGTIVVPVDMTANIYQFVSNRKVMSEISEFLKGGSGPDEKKGLITLKVRPSIKVGNSLIKYPGFISIDKEVSSKILL
ncbi:lipoprotein [Pedobacter antarcticus]|uniref:lipoprotein n=1 Tax=Pedobacter antarcticus TaxID=34086 RepID=UPI001C587849|nr:lipoprotein [Pedobacter antarcticus]